ncbi:early endosome antigen 1 [Enoplosus armatus]|uniref:early endosome antigen 1 n=1 Tax=Enoplosus armatus TaxID=215367 RepID=UPI003994DF2E
MWDTNSRFTAQTSAWCGMATVSGTGFLSKVSTSTSGSTSGFRQNDPGLKKWQSLSHLAPEGATRSFPPCPGAELRAARGESSFRQAEAVQCLQDTHERLDTQLDRLRTRNSQLSYNITTAKLLDMKHKQLSEAMSTLEQKKEAAELSQFEKSRQRGELHEKVLQLEKDLLQMRSTLDRGGNDQPTERTPGSLSRSLPMSQEDFNRQEMQKVDTELYKLREALRDAEVRAKTQEEERNQALRKLQTSTETQRTLLNQIEEMNQRFNHTKQNHSEVQEQLSEANNKISQACLEKAILSTQVLKLEDDIKELKAKLTRPLDHLIQEKADLHQRVQVLELQLKKAQQSSEGREVLVIQADTEEKSKALGEVKSFKWTLVSLRQVNIKLTSELEMIQQKLKTSQSQLQEITAERVINSKQVTDLETECSQLIREKEELSKMNEGRHEELTEMKKKCCQFRKSVEVLELEKLKLQDQCLSLEAEVLQKEEKLHLQEEEYQKQDAMRVQSTEELQAVAAHWTDKWQQVALTLQSTQEELEKLKKNNSTTELQEEAVHLASEIEKLKKEGQKDKEEIENLLQHKATMETVLTRAKKESDSLLRVELDACKQELELERSRSQALLHRYKDKGKALILFVMGATIRLPEQPKQIPSESRRTNQLQQEKTLAVQKIQTLRQLHLVKDEKPSVEDRKDKSVSPVILETAQQRRMVTEQLKNLFKEREGKEVGQADNRSAAAQTEASSPQDWTPTSKVTRIAADRKSWQQGSGLMPVFEEDEESSDWPEGEEGKPAEENFRNRSQQVMTMSAEISNLKAKNVKLLQDGINLQQKRLPSLYPDGIFLAELVDICSPDEDEEEGK